LNSGEYGEHRLFIVNFDRKQVPEAGTNTSVIRAGTEAGVRCDSKSWPHGFHGDAYPHGRCFPTYGCGKERNRYGT